MSNSFEAGLAVSRARKPAMPLARALASIALAWACVAPATPANAQSEPAAVRYTVAVVPQFPASEIHRDWTPVLERLSRDTGLSLSLRIAESVPRFEADFAAGGPDFVYLNPYHQILAMRAQGYQPLVRDARLLTGILVVRNSDPIRSVKELDGKEIAFPAPNALGASLWLRALLIEREKITFSPVYVQTHSNVYRQVIRGKSAAGGGVNNTLAQERDEVRAEMRVLMETPGVAPHPLSAHPRVPARARQALADALLHLGTDPTGQALLKDIQMPRPVRADHARDYQPLELYKLEKYVVRD
ncbi:MAG: phosphate/phosphite/phosphonate ABC transporter substrate-binding protein, partial [Burkholderiaceae bacterium]|nr:phosphate/phosphite/phosphonate ABC transporter substrate-binding protein [Burkholderiaceae bacterium]